MCASSGAATCPGLTALAPLNGCHGMGSMG